MRFALIGLLTGVMLETAQADADDSGSPPGSSAPGPDDHRMRPPHPPHGFAPPMRLREFDTDNDGRVSRAEVDLTLRARFKAADKNGDGTLDKSEFEESRPKPPEGGPPPGAPPHGEANSPPDAPPPAGGWHHRMGGLRPPGGPDQLFKRVDWNLDGQVSFEEFAAPIRQMAAMMDRNADGVVEKDELPGRFGPPGAPPPREK